MNGSSVVVVTNIPRPYRSALFAAIRPKLELESLGLSVFYTSDPSKHVRRGSVSPVLDHPRDERYIPAVAFRLGYERVLTIPTGLRRALGEIRPACVVVGGFSVDALVAAHWCGLEEIPYVIWSGGWVSREPDVGSLQLTSRRRLIRRANAFIAYGSAAADYLVSLGARPERVFRAWNTVDLEGISAAARAAALHRSDMVPKYRLAARNLLFVGSLVERKGVKELVAAALTAEPRDGDWALHLVGPGPLKGELERTVKLASADAHFRFHGSRSKEDVAELLGVADGFLLPTKREPWGLVINEAMACGVPVVVSPWAGATRDLVEDRVSGYVVEPSDAGALARAISRLLAGDPSTRAVGRAGAETVRMRASLESSATGFVSAIKCALSEYPDARR